MRAAYMRTLRCAWSQGSPCAYRAPMNAPCEQMTEAMVSRRLAGSYKNLPQYQLFLHQDMQDTTNPAPIVCKLPNPSRAPKLDTNLH